MDNNSNNYQTLNKNLPPDVNFQQGYGSMIQTSNMGNMQPYNIGHPAITYNVNSQPITEDNLPEKFKPISAWGYLGYNLLFSIPLIGNLRNYARSFFCIALIQIIIAILLIATGALGSLTSGSR